ncbi:HDOD domain-containing protein [Massilia arenosa]|uniref:HDOD domain-containing protein n=1 Tax=Zemynaea arenosa TaxID=2561931 RepID=A0A4Y9S7Z9_9BURK|nr:HDOD domain-containing protein [Massilia arenosa]TFW17687.1 HDOD domain-containing protein [Massilia arenosa]
MNAAVLAPKADPVDELIKSIRIPPRPSLLASLQQELNREEPAPHAIARIIASDVGMSAALLKLANSSFYGGKRKAKSVDQAIMFLGINQVAALMTGLLARQAIQADNTALADFWEISTQRAQAMVFLARRLAIGEPDVAHTFGLFCDTGMPLLMERFGRPYGETLELAAHAPVLSYTAVENARHMTSHAAIGCLLAKSWGLPPDVSWSILHHHDYDVIDDEATPHAVRALIATSLLAEYAIRKYQGHGDSAEWTKGGARACAHLGLGPEETAELLDELLESFHGD